MLLIETSVRSPIGQITPYAIFETRLECEAERIESQKIVDQLKPQFPDEDLKIICVRDTFRMEKKDVI